MTPDDIYHVFPVNDEKVHLLNCNFRPIGLPFCECECKPEHEEQKNGTMVIIHNSFDGREGLEWTNEILNSTNGI